MALKYYCLKATRSSAVGTDRLEPYLGMSIPAAEQAAMTVDPLGMETEAPLTVTSMSLLGAAAGCSDAEQVVWNVLSAGAALHTGACRAARRLCAASDRRLSTVADLPDAMMPVNCCSAVKAL